MNKYGKLAEAIRKGTIETTDEGNKYISELRELETYKHQGEAVAFDFDRRAKMTAIDLLESLDTDSDEDDAMAEWSDGEVSCYTWDLKCAALAFADYENEIDGMDGKPVHMGYVDYTGSRLWYEAAREYASKIKSWADEQDMEDDENEA